VQESAISLPGCFGLQTRVPYAKYRAIDAVNISSLKEMDHSPKRYQYRLDHPKESKALTFGNAGHVAVLEPSRFMRDYAVWGERTKSGKLRPRNGKTYDAFVEASAGKTILTEDEFNAAVELRDAVRGEPKALRYLKRGEPEVSMLWVDPGTQLLCKGREDWITVVDGCDVLVGLKTARDIRPIPFGNAAANLGYHLQWAYYFDGYVRITGRKPRLVEIVVENAPPYDVAVYRIQDDVIEVGRSDYQQHMLRLVDCRASGEWPGAVEEERDVTLPSRVFGDEAEISGLELEA
jgi:hypothetical protein